MNEGITILIATDHTLLRETWSFMLNSDPRFHVIAETSDEEECIELAWQLLPQVVILDIHFQQMNSIEITEIIRRCSPLSKILGISMHTNHGYVRKMIQNGAMGCITKHCGSAEMFKAIIEIHEGREYVSDDIKKSIAEVVIGLKKGNPGVNFLSQREIEVIGHIKTGKSSKEIAKELDIAKRTIEVHRYNIMKKLGLKNVASLINYINNYQLELDERSYM